MRPQHAADRFHAEPGATAFVGNRRAPAADPVLAAVELGPADRTRADDDHAPVAAAVRADAGRMRVGRDDGLAERMIMPLRG
jgi:hypothetical protein